MTSNRRRARGRALLLQGTGPSRSPPLARAESLPLAQPALITATQIAIGYKNDNGFRIYGSEGSPEWHQERAEKLLVRRGEVDETYWIGAGYSYLTEAMQPYLRVPPGHNEDFFEALGNLHLSMELEVRRRRGEEGPAPFDHPDAQTGLDGMRFVRAAVDSSKAGGAWTDL